jgi:proline iminopeptidase
MKAPGRPLGLLPPFASRTAVASLPVGDGNELYVEKSGNPEGVPILFVHGGPGAACSEANRHFFDPLA